MILRVLIIFDPKLNLFKSDAYIFVQQSLVLLLHQTAALSLMPDAFPAVTVLFVLTTGLSSAQLLVRVALLHKHLKVEVTLIHSNLSDNLDETPTLARVTDIKYTK